MSTRITGERVDPDLLKMVEQQTGTGQQEEEEVRTPVLGFLAAVKTREEKRTGKREDYSNIVLPRFRQ